MRAIPFALLLLGSSAAIFILSRLTVFGDVEPLSAAPALIGFAGACILLADVYGRVDRRVNRPPSPPYFTINEAHGSCCLELDADGSYESCELLLSTLAEEFGATYSRHLDAGPRPNSDKDKGYWNVTMFGQEFFVMRDRGYGISISGTHGSADVNGFDRVAAHFQALEFLTWQQKLARLVTDSWPPVVAEAK